ncbi:UNVERIFIED_CONTAM: hypothetical protein HDU68_003254 [Siphonaria sp. JEL0065]|nr:hypothetical protein HDU68_003254 [Siphonaria sp. JEL0065]
MASTTEEHFLTVRDPKTNTTIKVPINTLHNTIPSSAFTALKITQTTPLPPTAQQTPLRIYDPGFKNTVVCKSKISQLDSDSGHALRYRGFSVDDLVEKSSFLETENEKWTQAIMSHTYVHAELEKQMTTFRYDAHPMGMLIATIASLSTFHPDANPALQGDGMYMKPKGADAKQIEKATANRNRAIYRILGKVSTMASYAYRNRIGRTYNAPMPNCTNYAENFLYMIDKLNEPDYVPDKRIVTILDKMFILLAEHGSNCSTITMRHLASSGVDPYTALSGSYGALFGERKAAAVMGMLHLIGTPENVPAFLQLVKEKKSIKKESNGSLVAAASGKPTRLQGFGHRIYKSLDPRVKIAKSLALELFSLIGQGEMGTLALALEQAALADPWFQSRHLFTNIDFWTAIVFHTLGFPADMFPVLTAIPRTAGLVAHWQESLDDPEYKIYRPRQIFNGVFVRDYKGDRAVLDEEEQEVVEQGDGGYAKSLPAEANKRLSLNSGGIEEAKLAEFKNMIERTKHSIQELSTLTGVSPTGAAPSSPKYQPMTKIGAWVMGKTSSSDLRASEKLAKTQKELQDLLQQQQELLELYMTHRSATQQSGTPSGSPEKVVSKSPSLNKLSTIEPDLLAGSHSPRPIMKKAGEQ